MGWHLAHRRASAALRLAQAELRLPRIGRLKVMIRRWLLLLAGCSWLAWRQLCNHIQASVRLLLVPIPECRNSRCSAAMGAAAQPSACLAVHVLPLQQDACEGALQQLLPRLLATCEGVLGLDCEWQPETQSKQHNRRVACVQKLRRRDGRRMQQFDYHLGCSSEASRPAAFAMACSSHSMSRQLNSMFSQLV